MNLKSRLFIVPALLCTMLTGCGDSNIDLVKATNYPVDPTHTYGSALSKRAACDDIDWRTFKDDNNRLVVEYRCKLKGAVAALQVTRDADIKDSRQTFEGGISNLRKEVEDEKNKPAMLESMLQAQKAKLASLEEKVQQAVANEPDPSRAIMVKRVNEQMYLAGPRSIISRLEQELEEAKSGKNVDKYQQEIAQQQQKLYDTVGRIQQHYNGVKSVTEVIQWVVKDKEVIPVFFGFESDTELGKKVSNQSQPIRFAYWLRQITLKRGADYVTLAAPAMLDGVGATSDKKQEPAQSPQAASQVKNNRGEGCYNDKVNAFHKEAGEDALVSHDMMNEWRQQCGLPTEEID